MSCWTWAGPTTLGYGYTQYEGQRVLVHRAAYEALVGTIPPGLQLDHLCRNRACYNPAHLEPVSVRTNVLRGDGVTARNAAKTHCVNGHEFTDENTYREPRGRGCKTCRVENTRAWRARQKELMQSD